MIGTRVALLRPRPTAALLWIAAAVVLALSGIAGHVPAVVVAALLPIAIGVSPLLRDRRRLPGPFPPPGLPTHPPPPHDAVAPLRRRRSRTGASSGCGRWCRWGRRARAPSPSRSCTTPAACSFPPT